MIHIFHTPTGWKVCPEYPERMAHHVSGIYHVITNHEYNQAVALSIANAVDVRDQDLVKKQVWKNPAYSGMSGDKENHYKESLEGWKPDDKQVYALPELEMGMDKCPTCDGHGQLSRPPFDDSGECPICKGRGQLAHVFRKKEEPKMEETQEELWQMIQDEMIEDFKWPKDLLELLKSKFHLTRVKEKE